jgi:hypothetical protein
VQIGNMLGRLGRHAEALRYYRRAETIRAAGLQADAASLWKRASLIEIRVCVCSSLAALRRVSEATAACASSAALMDQTRVPPDDAVLRTFLADSYTTLGDAYTVLVRAGGPSNENTGRRHARDMYKRSADLWGDLRRRGIVAAADAAKPEAAAHALAKADAALHGR